jgi:hypothetical protein
MQRSQPSSTPFSPALPRSPVSRCRRAVASPASARHACRHTAHAATGGGEGSVGGLDGGRGEARQPPDVPCTASHASAGAVSQAERRRAASACCTAAALALRASFARHAARRAAAVSSGPRRARAAGGPDAFQRNARLLLTAAACDAAACLRPGCRTDAAASGSCLRACAATRARAARRCGRRTVAGAGGGLGGKALPARVSGGAARDANEGAELLCSPRAIAPRLRSNTNHLRASAPAARQLIRTQRLPRCRLRGSRRASTRLALACPRRKDRCGARDAARRAGAGCILLPRRTGSPRNAQRCVLALRPGRHAEPLLLRTAHGEQLRHPETARRAAAAVLRASQALICPMARRRRPCAGPARLHLSARRRATHDAEPAAHAVGAPTVVPCRRDVCLCTLSAQPPHPSVVRPSPSSSFPRAGRVVTCAPSTHARRTRAALAGWPGRHFLAPGHVPRARRARCRRGPSAVALLSDSAAELLACERRT